MGVGSSGSPAANPKASFHPLDGIRQVENTMLDLIFLTCFVLIGGAGIALWIKTLLRKKNRQDPLGCLGGRNLMGSPLGLIDVFLVFFAWMGGQVVAVGFAMLVLGVSHEDLPTLAGEEEAKLLGIVGLAQLIGILLAMAVLYVRYGRGGRSQAIGIHPSDIVKDVALGFAAFAMVIPIVLLIQWLLTLLVEYDHPSLTILTKDASLLTFVLVWFVAGFVAPVCEEFFFRGTLQPWLQRLGRERLKSDQILVGGWDSEAQHGEGKAVAGVEAILSAESKDESDPNPYRAPRAVSSTLISELSQGSGAGPRSWITQSHWPIYVTSAIFAGLHLGQGAAPIPLFVLAVVLGYLYRKTESILPCIVLHMLLNTFSLFWFTINVFFGTEAGL